MKKAKRKGNLLPTLAGGQEVRDLSRAWRGARPGW
jgi:hypothetical protein